MAPEPPPAEEEERVVVDDCRGVLLVYSDGAVERKAAPGFATPVRDDGAVEWKDATFDAACLYRPRHALAGKTRLPVGATAVHPFGPENSDDLAAAEFAPTMVVVGGRDLLRDRAVDYAERLKAMGKPVEVVEFEGQQHGFFAIDPWSDAASELMRAVKRFVDTDGGRRRRRTTSIEYWSL